MANVAGAIRAAIKTALAKNTTAGGYFYDLTGTDQVVQGWYDAPPRTGLAQVMIAHWTVSTTPGPPLSQESVTAEFLLMAWAPATADTADARATASEQIADDVAKRLRIATRTSGEDIAALSTPILEVAIQFEPVAPLEQDVAAWAQIAITAAFTYRVSLTGGI